MFLALVYFQWLFWLLIHYSDYKIGDKLYRFFPYLIYFMFIFFMGLGFTDFCIDAIKPHHLMTYSALILICYKLLDNSNKFNNKDVICLSFLIVFINSEYWEFPYRFFKIMNYGMDKLDIQQLAHLLPFYGLHYTFDYKRVNFKILVKGLILLFITSTIRLFILQNILFYNCTFYMVLQRMMALYFLTRFYIISDYIKNEEKGKVI